MPHDPVGRSDRLFLVCTGEQHKIICFAKLWRQAATHEWITPKGTDDERYSLRELFQFLRFKPVWTHFLTILLSTVGTSLSSGTGTFFYTYIMKDLKLMSGVSVVSLVITLLGMAVAPVLANKLGKKNVFLAGIIVAVGGSLIRFIDVRSLLLIYVGAVFAGIGGGFIGPLAYGIQADNTMYKDNYRLFLARQPQRLSGLFLRSLNVRCAAVILTRPAPLRILKVYSMNPKFGGLRWQRKISLWFSGEDAQLAARFTKCLTKALYNRRVSYLRAKSGAGCKRNFY